MLSTTAPAVMASSEASPAVEKTKNSPKRNRSAVWLMVLNSVIALCLVAGVIFLQGGADRYKPHAKFDKAYIQMTEAEKDLATLRHGILHTEAARATAYQSVVRLSHGTSLTWTLVALAFIINALYMMRMQRRERKSS